MQYTLSTGQAAALLQIGSWYRGRTAPFLTLGGYAGTGKTTLVAYLRKALNEYDSEARVAFCAPTGKAARLLDERLKEQGVPKRRDSVSTVHSLIYTVVTDSGRITGWRLKPELERDLIIVDEASMIDEQLWQDLLSFKVPVLAVGDHGQLPPVNSSFNLMAKPELKLEQIYRQREDSPIIEVATLARTEGVVPVQQFGPGVRKLSRYDSETGQAVQDILESWNEDTLILCGLNRTRQRLNVEVRALRGYESAEPSSGDRVICLRNNRFSKLFNGMIGTIVSVAPAENDQARTWYDATIRLDNEKFDYSGYIWRPQFGAGEVMQNLPSGPDGKPGDLFDFGYALTVHKAQGSQAERVLLFEERFSRMSDDDWRRWLYTGVTRATDQLTVVGAPLD